MQLHFSILKSTYAEKHIILLHTLISYSYNCYSRLVSDIIAKIAAQGNNAERFSSFPQR